MLLKKWSVKVLKFRYSLVAQPLPKRYTSVKSRRAIFWILLVHVLDASRSVGVASKLLSEDKRADYILDIRKDYDRIREQRKNRTSFKKYLTLKQARANKLQLDWDNFTPVKPAQLGIQVFDNYSLEELSKFIDWTPFFSSWQLAGKYPAILEDKIVGVEATKLLKDAQELLKQIIEEKWLTARAVIGLFPANAVNDDDIEVYADDRREEVQTMLRNLRQQRAKAKKLANISLTDFIAPKETANDYIGAFAVTTGIGIEKHVKRFEAEHDDYNAIMLKALADRLAEAFAECMHQRVRKEFWAYAKDETLVNEELISEKYQGIRPAPGYPACPEHTEKQTLFELLDVTNNTGIQLTESCAMYPAASVSGWYYGNAESKYFGLGQISKDQVQDYAERKGMSFEEAEKWLSPVLNYDV